MEASLNRAAPRSTGLTVRNLTSARSLNPSGPDHAGLVGEDDELAPISGA